MRPRFQAPPRNAGFIRQQPVPLPGLPDESGVPPGRGTMAPGNTLRPKNFAANALYSFAPQD
jgi:hypothetical protein